MHVSKGDAFKIYSGALSMLVVFLALACTGPGKYTIKNVPAGTYTVEAWHEKLGVRKEKITIADGDKKTLNFTCS